MEFFKNCLTPIPDLKSKGITTFQNAILKLGHNILDASIGQPEIVEFNFDFPCLRAYPDVRFFLSIRVYKSNVDIIEESLNGIGLDAYSESNLMYYYTNNDNCESKVLIENWDKKYHEINPDFGNELSFFAIPELLMEQGVFRPEQVPLYKLHKYLREKVQEWQFYNANEMDLAKIRGANPKIGLNDIILSKSGENLPTVLDNLFNHIKYGLDFEERINNAMKEILPMSHRLKTTREGMSLSVQWYFDGMETPFYLDDMSDGTVRMLCWAIILYSPILPTLLVIDEPELSLHIAWMRTLAQWIKQASQKTQIIISTHSPDLLDYFTDCANDVICFEKAQQKGHFQAKKLPETILQEKIAEGWQLGDLYRIGDDIIGGWPW